MANKRSTIRAMVRGGFDNYKLNGLGRDRTANKPTIAGKRYMPAYHARNRAEKLKAAIEQGRGSVDASGTFFWRKPPDRPAPKTPLHKRGKPKRWRGTRAAALIRAAKQQHRVTMKTGG